MRCYIPHDDVELRFETVKEAREWLSDPVNIERLFGDYEDDYYVEILQDKDYGEYEDPIHIDGWELRQIRLFLGLPLRKTSWPYMVRVDRRIEEYDNYEDWAARERQVYPSRWEKAKGLVRRKI